MATKLGSLGVLAIAVSPKERPPTKFDKDKVLSCGPHEVPSVLLD